jgi:hypothetical protein
LKGKGLSSLFVKTFSEKETNFITVTINITLIGLFIFVTDGGRTVSFLFLTIFQARLIFRAG